MKEGFLTTERGKIWYAVYGEEIEKTPVIVVHGGPGFLSMTKGISDLAEDRPVYFYDQLGCGKSDHGRLQTDYTVDNYVEELGNVIKEFDLDKFILLGISWGAGLVCKYVLEHEEQNGIESLILSSPYLSTPLWKKDTAKRISRLEPHWIEAIERGEKQQDYGDAYQGALIEYYKKHMYCRGHFPDEVMSAFGQMNQDIYGLMWGPGEFEINGTLSDFDLFPELHKITVPVLLTCGDRDEVDVATMSTYQETFPNAQLAVLPYAAHLHHLEQPELYKMILRNFLE